MIEYLKNYNISLEEWDLIEVTLDKNMLLNFKVMENNVCNVISYFHEIGIKKLANIIIYRPDLCFKTKEYLQEQFSKMDIELLKYVIDNNIDDLICFNI